MPGASSPPSSTGSKPELLRPTWGCDSVAQVGPKAPKATVAIAGSSGLIGSALAAALRAADHPVLRIVRRTPANSDELHWNPESGDFYPEALVDVDAVVNLCGVNIGQRRWSGAFNQSLR